MVNYFVFYTLLLISFLYSSPETSTFSIQYVSQFHSASDLGWQKKLGQRISDFLFGKGNVALNRPYSLFVGRDKNFWIIDQGSSALFYFNSDEQLVESFSGSDQRAFGTLIGLCQDKSGRTLFTDSVKGTVYILDNPGSRIRKFAMDNQFERPTGIAYSALNDMFWIVETGKHRLTEIDGNGKLLRNIGGRGTGNGQFNFPTFLWIDTNGDIYVVDAMNYRVQIFSQDGEFITQFGKQGDASGYFAHPKGIAVDSKGHIYVVDALFHEVQIFDRAGNFLYGFGGQGRESGQFWLPAGICIDLKDQIYVADSYNSRIQVFKLVQGKP